MAPKHNIECGQQWRLVLKLPWHRVYWCKFHRDIEVVHDHVVRSWW